MMEGLDPSTIATVTLLGDMVRGESNTSEKAAIFGATSGTGWIMVRKAL